MQINFAKASLPTRGAVALLVPMDQKKTGLLAQIDKRTKGALGRAMKSADFKGKKGQSLVYLSPTGTSLVAVVLIGVGAVAKLKPIDIEDAGGHAYARLQGTKAKSAMLATELLDGADIESSEIAAMAASGALLRSYRFDRYRTKRKTGDRTALSKIIFSSADAAQSLRQFAPRNHLASVVFLTRHLVSEPPNILYPEEFARRAKELSELGVKVDILDEKRLEKENMRALLGVGQGSRRDSRLVVMDWRGSKDSKSKPVAFVGKGVTFDTGGISLKPGLNMHEMKYDLGGA